MGYSLVKSLFIFGDIVVCKIWKLKCILTKFQEKNYVSRSLCGCDIHDKLINSFQSFIKFYSHNHPFTPKIHFLTFVQVSYLLRLDFYFCLLRNNLYGINFDRPNYSRDYIGPSVVSMQTLTNPLKMVKVVAPQSE